MAKYTTYGINSGKQLDVTLKNINEMNEHEYAYFNHQAREVALAILGMGGSSPKDLGSRSKDFRDRVSQWTNELQTQASRRANQFRQNHDQPRDTETGRYVERNPLLDALDEPREPEDMLGAVNAHNREMAVQREASEPQELKLDDGRRSYSIPHNEAQGFDDPKFKWEDRNGTRYQVPKVVRPSHEYAPGTGSGMSNETGKLAYHVVKDKNGRQIN